MLHGFSGGAPTPVSTPELLARSLSVVVALGASVIDLPGGLRSLEEAALVAAASGELVPAVQTFPLHEAAAAHEALEGRRTSGKVVLLPERRAQFLDREEFRA